MGSSSLQLASPSCPVCGEPVLDEARTCSRCETPHHPDCWEYVPGCAVFGCADAAGAVLPVESWSRAHQLLLWRVRVVGLAALTMQTFMITIVGILLHAFLRFSAPPIWTLGLLLVTGIATPVLMVISSSFDEWQESVQGTRFLERATVEGDRRLARAVAERAGRLLPVPPALAAAVVPGFFLLGALGSTPVGELLSPLFLAGFLYALLFAGFYFPAAWVGQQRILANRLDAAIRAGEPVKELEAPP